MKEINLTQGYKAVVSDEDYECLNQLKWMINKRDKNHLYARRTHRINGKRQTIQMHRFLMNAPEGMEVDHKNGDGLDNRRGNLRICTKSQNAFNRRKVKGLTSKYKGVSWCRTRKRWVTALKLKGKTTFFGIFKSELEAAIIANITMRRHYGEFARPSKLTKISYKENV